MWGTRVFDAGDCRSLALLGMTTVGFYRHGGVQGSFVGRPSRCEGLRLLRMACRTHISKTARCGAPDCATDLPKGGCCWVPAESRSLTSLGMTEFGGRHSLVGNT